MACLLDPEYRSPGLCSQLHNSLDIEDTFEARDQAPQRLDIAPALAAEIMYVNDEDVAYWRTETPEQRWERVRAWVVEQIR